MMGASGWTYGLVGAILAAGGLMLFLYRDMNTLDPWYFLLLVAGTLVVSFVVGYILGYFTEKGLEPTSDDRE